MDAVDLAPSNCSIRVKKNGLLIGEYEPLISGCIRFRPVEVNVGDIVSVSVRGPFYKGLTKDVKLEENNTVKLVRKVVRLSFIVMHMALKGMEPAAGAEVSMVFGGKTQ